MSATTRAPRTAEETATHTAWQAFFTRKTHRIMVTEKQLAGWMHAAIINDRHETGTPKES